MRWQHNWVCVCMYECVCFVCDWATGCIRSFVILYQMVLQLGYSTFYVHLYRYNKCPYIGAFAIAQSCWCLVDQSTISKRVSFMSVVDFMRLETLSYSGIQEKSWKIRVDLCLHSRFCFNFWKRNCTTQRTLIEFYFYNYLYIFYSNNSIKLRLCIFFDRPLHNNNIIHIYI